MRIIRNYLEPKLTVLVFGATGLVGTELIKILEKDRRYGEIKIVNRKKVHYDNGEIQQLIIDFDNLSQKDNFFNVNHVFICLGTTMKEAGSQQNFEKVDFKYPLEIAKISKSKKVNALVHISSLGANSNSSNFYLRTKGRAEEEIETHGPRSTFAVRPSMLLGDRTDKRFGEQIGKSLLKGLEFLMVGKLKQYRSIRAEDVARAMVEIANKKPKNKRISSEELRVISRQNVLR